MYDDDVVLFNDDTLFIKPSEDDGVKSLLSSACGLPCNPCTNRISKSRLNSSPPANPQPPQAALWWLRSRDSVQPMARGPGWVTSLTSCSPPAAELHFLLLVFVLKWRLTAQLSRWLSRRRSDL